MGKEKCVKSINKQQKCQMEKELFIVLIEKFHAVSWMRLCLSLIQSIDTKM